MGLAERCSPADWQSDTKAGHRSGLFNCIPEGIGHLLQRVLRNSSQLDNTLILGLLLGLPTSSDALTIYFNTVRLLELCESR